MKNKLLETAQKIVNYVHSNMGESCQCMFCGHHHIHTDETNMQERYEKTVCPFVELERAVIEAAQQSVQPTVLCTCRKDILGTHVGSDDSCPVHGSHSG